MGRPEPLATSDGRCLRALVGGAAVIVGGSLAATTVIGLAAIAGMAMRGDSADSIVAEFSGSMALAVFVALGGLLMSLIGGYIAATIAGRSQYWHALVAGAIATIVTVALLPVWGDTGPVWLTTLSTAGIVPLAAVGAWLAMPVPVLTVAAGER